MAIRVYVIIEDHDGSGIDWPNGFMEMLWDGKPKERMIESNDGSTVKAYNGWAWLKPKKKK